MTLMVKCTIEGASGGKEFDSHSYNIQVMRKVNFPCQRHEGIKGE
jgi:hypothetical protein